MRILLLSLYYPPLNTIAATRIAAFEKYLKMQGIELDVITRYYDLEQQKGQSMFLGKEKAKNFNENYRRIDNVIYSNYDETNSKLSFSNFLPPIIKGLYNYWQVDVFHYGWIRYAEMAFEKECSKNKYDFIISSYGPPISMLLANRISKKHSIPFLIDFRDSYINEKDKTYHLKMKQFSLNRMLSNCSGLIFSTEGMQNYFAGKVSKKINEIPFCVVYNGVDEVTNGWIEKGEIAKSFYQIKQKHTLLLLHTGTLYEGQNSKFFIEAVERYNEANKKNVAIVFLGLAENKANEIPRLPFIYFLPKVGHSAAMYFQKEADALLLPIWDGRYTGFSGKTQEYLYSGNFIITSPNPQNDLKTFLNLSPNVKICNDYNSFEDFISKICSRNYSKLQLQSKEKLFRSYWVQKLAVFLTKLKLDE